MLDLSASTSRAEHASGHVLHEVARLRRAAWAFTTRRVPRGSACKITCDGHTPQAGDLVLARVDAIGHHKALQLSNGRRKHLFVGDEIVVTYGNRYAPNQFEAVVPETLGPCQLVAGGGIAAKALSWHARIASGPTQITPLGLLTDTTGVTTNLRDYALHAVDRLASPYPTTVAVVGTAMDSGKTQTAAYLVKGLTLAGLRVGYAKVTGTGAGDDTWFLRDAGADPVLDFTDAGWASTYLTPQAEIKRVFLTLMGHMIKVGVDAVVLEIADGVLQVETAALLESVTFGDIVSGVLFAARDSLGAVGGHSWLQQHGVHVLGLSGVLTAAPLQRQEALTSTGLPIFSREDLAQPRIAMTILDAAVRKRALESS